MRRWMWALVALLGVFGCEDDLSDDQIVAAKADQTLRQLVAGMNAQKPPVLAKLLVMTSTTGGPPRALRPAELDTLVFPKPPFAYAGPGKPGYMHVKDGEGRVHRIHLVVTGDALKVVARRTSMAGGGIGAQVTTFLEPVAGQ